MLALVVLILLILVLLILAACLRNPVSRSGGGRNSGKQSENVLPQPPIVLLTEEHRTVVEILTIRHKYAPDGPVNGRDPANAPIFGSKVGNITHFGLPFFRIKRGNRPLLRLINKTGFTFDIHWHGLNTTADVDGASGQVEFGEGTKIGPILDIDFPTIQNNSTLLWLHAHPMFRSSPFLYRGLFGLLDVVDDASAAVHRLFHYPDNRVLLFFQDADLTSDGQLTDANLSTDEARGCFGTINGVTCVNWFSGQKNRFVVPMLEKRLRGRSVVKIDFLNATSSFRYVHLGVCNTKGKILPFWLVQVDDGLQNPVQLRMVTVAPANRVGLLVDATDNDNDLFVFFYNYDLSENFGVSPGGTGTDPTDLQGLIPVGKNPTPNPTPIPDSGNENPQGDPSPLTYPALALIPQVNAQLPFGEIPPPPAKKFTIKRFLRLVVKAPQCKISSPTLQACLTAVREVVFGCENAKKHAALICTPGFEYKTHNYIGLLNPRYFYNLPQTGPQVAARNIMLVGDDDENSGDPYGSTEYVDGENRVMADLWNSAELDLSTALTAYTANPNNYRPAVLPTLLFKIYPASTSSNYTMLTNDTLQVELFSSPISYGDTTTVPLASATVQFPATGDNGKPLNLAEWVALVAQRFANTSITIPPGPAVPLSTLLQLQWSFFPWSQLLLTGQAVTLKSVIMINTNLSATYTVRFRAPWNLLQFFGKSIGIGMASMSGMMTGGCSKCKCGDNCQCTESKRCSPGCVCWKKKKPGKGCCSKKKGAKKKQQQRQCSDCKCGADCKCTPGNRCSPTCTCGDMDMSNDANLQQMYPAYATSDPETQIVLSAMGAQAELIIAPASEFRGFLDGFQSDNLFNFSVRLNSTERLIYHNMDAEDSHPLHVHLSSGFVDPLSSDNSPGMVTAARAYWPQLYSKDVYGIGPQQKLTFYFKFAHHTSKEKARKPGVRNLSFMYHCHFMEHHDMNMMGSYFVYRHRPDYFS